MTTIIRFPTKAKTVCSGGLPPYPAVRMKDITAANDRFSELDLAVDVLFSRHPPPPAFLVMVAKSKMSVRNYVRRCVVVAGMLAWNEAARWQQDRVEIRKRRNQLIDDVDTILATADRLLRATSTGLDDVEQRRRPKLADPALIEAYARQTLPLEKLKASLEVILSRRTDLEDASADIAALDPGREDVLSRHFIQGLAAGWRDMTGKYPATARSGPFVSFVDNAWTVCGWGGYSLRTSLGKLVFGVSREQNWSMLNAKNSS